MVFDNATLQPHNPELAYTDTALEKLATNKVDNELHFDVALKTGAKIKDVTVFDEEKNPHIVLSFEFDKVAENAVGNDKSAVKTPAVETLISEQYQRALQLAERGDEQKAIHNLSTILKSEPDYSDARVSLAALLIHAGKVDQAQAMIEQGLDIDPGYAALIELKARLLVASGHVKDALAILQINAPALADNPDYHAFMAALYAHNNDNLLSAKIYKKLLAQDERNGNWWFGFAVAMDKLGRSKAAYEAYSRAATEGKLNTEAALYLQHRLQAMKGNTHETE